MIADTQRRILFLQGPPSTFWRQLCDHFESSGAITRRINFSMGDWVYWRKPGADSYRGRFSKWGQFLRTYLLDHRITDILYYADRLPYHAVAREVAASLGIRTYAVEFGYLRPDWLTLERGAMGALSHFPNDPEAIRQIARQVRSFAQPKEHFTHRFAQEATNEVVYNLLTALVPYAYPFYRADKYYHPIVDYLSWIPSALRKMFTERKRSAEALRLRTERKRYWMLALQIQADYQLRTNAPYHRQADMIAEVIESFAKHAHPEGHLIVKLHPLDNGIERWERLVDRLAKKHNVGGRVLAVSECDLKRTIRRSRGVITINSTVGLHSLRAGTPVKVLGIAVYDIPGLTHQGSLDLFWRKPQKVDKTLRNALVSALAATLQVHGSFYHPEGRVYACREIVHRVMNDLVNEPGAFVDPPPRLKEAIERKVPIFNSLKGSGVTPWEGETKEPSYSRN
ncbi:capsule biosynthesis protein [Bordetella genomosp. 4]|uniref:capsule biosynthesis protein n=1 Tax=Bordetella genomosp. 4 TaxID=463044 RepID=UPI000B9E9A74|nr:capsular biosynthesis protein [Bordetella genomosp. 4]OZI48363.1 capsular biosynthesis protein [Bordetella genomosp. 4]